MGDVTTHRVWNQVARKASATRAIVCQLRQGRVSDLTLNATAGETERIADKLDLEARKRSEALLCDGLW